MRVPLMSPSVAEGDEAKVENMLNAVDKIMGFIPDPLRLMGVSPPILEEFTQFLGQYESHPKFSGNLLILMRYLVAFKNDCQYCITTSEGLMIEKGMDLDDLRKAQRDPTKAPLPDKDKSLLVLVLKIILDPENMESADMETAYSHDWTDRDIYEAANYAVRNLAVDLLLRGLKIDGQGVFGS